ncbi:MAG: 5-formyltetrahydrofolate cyclo-ligase [Ruminococcaceae bacterium]|nr:5-formyltetrahydrofolate cyclo-ligase [Oscillospiraceae bacterium]
MADISQQKKLLRQRFLAQRRALPAEERQRRCSLITENLIGSDIYRQCGTLLLYISTPLEIDTFSILHKAQKDGKRIACPRCISADGLMTFHVIDSPEQLQTGSYGIMEPPESLPQAENTADALCILPALACDRIGLRLGYGKGYYDRFLAGFCGVSAVLCYGDALLDSLPHDRYDRHADWLVNEHGIFPCPVNVTEV